MTMNFHSAKKKKEQQKKSLVFGLVLLLIALGWTGVYRWMSTGFHPLSVPFWNIFQGGDASLSFIVADKRNLTQTIREQELHIKDLEQQLVRVQMLAQENEELKESFGRLRTSYITGASILVKPSHTLYDAMVIDVGSEDGVRQGDLVLSFGSVALGYVVDVRSTTSFVELFTQNNVMSNMVHIPTGTYVEAVGQGGSMFSFTLPRDVAVSDGEIIALPDSESFLVGTVERIDFNPTDPFQTVRVRSAVNINQIRFVELVRGYGEEF